MMEDSVTVKKEAPEDADPVESMSGIEFSSFDQMSQKSIVTQLVGEGKNQYLSV